MPRLKLTRALKPESTLQGHIRDGMGAIARKHHPLIAEGQRARIGDSLDLDEATKPGREQEHRWDYLVSLRDADRVIAIEPHTASDKEVRVLVKKKENAVALLREELRPGVKVASWHWVSPRAGFSRMEPALRALDQSGIKFHVKRILSLD